MATSERRAAVEAVAYGDKSSAHERLRALELLAELDRRESPLPERPAVDEEQELQNFDTTIRLIVENGFCNALIEERAQVLAAEMVRERFAVVENEAAGADESAAEEDATDEPSETPQAASEQEDAPRTHPIDEAAFRIIADDTPPTSSLRRHKCS